MLLFLYSVLLCDLVMFVSCETVLEIEVSTHLSSLEGQTYSPIKLHISTLTTKLENLLTNFTNYEFDSLDGIAARSEAVQEDLSSVADLFITLGGEPENCLKHVPENFRQIDRTASQELKDTTLDGISKAQSIITEGRTVFMAAQNYTLTAKMMTENCLLMLDDTECLMEALSMIVVMEQILPKIISIVGRQHERQLSLLEDEVISKMDGIVVRVHDKYVEQLDGFLMCILQEEE